MKPRPSNEVIGFVKDGKIRKFKVMIDEGSAMIEELTSTNPVTGFRRRRLKGLEPRPLSRLSQLVDASVNYQYKNPKKSLCTVNGVVKHSLVIPETVEGNHEHLLASNTSPSDEPVLDSKALSSGEPSKKSDLKVKNPVSKAAFVPLDQYNNVGIVKDVNSSFKPPLRSVGHYYSSPKVHESNLDEDSDVDHFSGDEDDLEDDKDFGSEKFTGFACSECGSMFPNLEKLYSHHLLHKKETNYVCELCGKKFGLKFLLEEHKRSHTDFKKYECDSCFKKFDYRDNLILHSRIHGTTKLFKCKRCSRNFVSGVMLANHMSVYHNISNKPAVMQDKPTVTQDKPAVTQDNPALTQDQPAVMQAKHTVTQNKYAVTQDKPAVTQDKPAVTQDKPTVTQDKPTVMQDKPIVIRSKMTPKYGIQLGNRKIVTHETLPNVSPENRTSDVTPTRKDFTVSVHGKFFPVGVKEDNHNGQKSVSFSLHNLKPKENNHESIISTPQIPVRENYKVNNSQSGKITVSWPVSVGGKVFPEDVQPVKNVVQMYSCDVCGHYFLRQDDMEKHRAKHIQYICFKCKKIFDEEHYYRCHISVCHHNLNEKKAGASNLSEKKSATSHLSNKKAAVSNLSEKKAAISNSSEKKAAATVVNTTSASCSFCKKTYQVPKTGKEDSEGNLRFICENCCALFAQKSQVSGFTPRLENRFICSKCDKCFSSEETLRDHITTHTNKASFICMKCKKHFSSLELLGVHHATHASGSKVKEGFICNECYRSFPSEELLREHVPTHAKDVFICNQCYRCFPSKVLLREHFPTHAKGTKEDFICNKCYRCFPSEELLREHIPTHAKSTKDGFICNKCYRCFPSEELLREHVPTHFKCTKCNIHFSSEKQLMEHLPTHSSNFTKSGFCCIKCGQSFLTRKALEKHKKSHVEEKIDGPNAPSNNSNISNLIKNKGSLPKSVQNNRRNIKTQDYKFNQVGRKIHLVKSPSIDHESTKFNAKEDSLPAITFNEGNIQSVKRLESADSDIGNSKRKAGARKSLGELANNTPVPAISNGLPPAKRQRRSPSEKQSTSPNNAEIVPGTVILTNISDFSREDDEFESELELDSDDLEMQELNVCIKEEPEDFQDLDGNSSDGVTIFNPLFSKGKPGPAIDGTNVLVKSEPVDEFISGDKYSCDFDFEMSDDITIKEEDEELDFLGFSVKEEKEYEEEMTTLPKGFIFTPFGDIKEER